MPKDKGGNACLLADGYRYVGKERKKGKVR